MKLRRITLAVAAALVGVVTAFSPESSQATVLTFHYHGHVTSNTAFGDIRVGDPVNAFVTVTANVSVPDGDPDPNVGVFEPTFEEDSDFAFGLIVFSPGDPDGSGFTSFPPFPVVTIYNDILPGDQFPGDSIFMGGDVGDNFGVGLSFRDPSGKALSSDAWTTRYDPSLWRSITGVITNFGSGSETPATLTASFTVPETISTLWLVLPLALMAVGARWTLRASLARETCQSKG
jgi:hypothetical protein